MEGALVELLNLTVERFPDLHRDSLFKGLLRRESTMTTYLGLGVAMPTAGRVAMEFGQHAHVRVQQPQA